MSVIIYPYSVVRRSRCRTDKMKCLVAFPVILSMRERQDKWLEMLTFHDLVMEAIICIGRFPRPGPRHLDYLALKGFEFHITVSLLHRQFVKSC